MDMKRILQALDGASTKPVEGANDMAKFLSVVDKNSSIKTINEEVNNNSVLKEGANPHKVSLPVQMAMQHYQKPQIEKKQRPALIDKYFSQVEEEQLQEKKERRQLINQYASVIAERIRLKESYNANLSPNPGFEPGPGGPGLQSNVAEEHNAPDVVTLDIPLLIRLLEYSREDAQTDMDLHDVAERMVNLSQDGRTLTMDDYDKICINQEQDVAEGRTIKSKRKSDPCWTGYHQVGMKTKDNRTVPNCVKKGKQQIDELSSDLLGRYKEKAGKAASAADKAGDYETGNKRFSGIVSATKKQFANDLKKHPGTKK